MSWRKKTASNWMSRLRMLTRRRCNSSLYSPLWPLPHPPSTGYCLTTTDALPLLVASVYPSGGAVFAPARLAEVAWVWPLGVLPVGCALMAARRALQQPGYAVAAGRVARGHGRRRTRTWVWHIRSRAASVVPTSYRAPAQAWTPWPHRRG